MSVKYWEAQAALYEFDYDTGTHAPVVGETINVDVEAGETAVVQAWTVTSGAWGSSSAAGKMWVYSCSADFIANLADNDNLDDSGSNQICITTGGVTAKVGDWQTSGNWGTGEDPSIPVDNDTVIFDNRSTQSVTDGIAVGETGGVTLDLLHVLSNFTGDIGTTSERLHINPDKVIFEGSGTMWLECSEDDAVTDSDIDLVICNSSAGTLKLSSDVNTSSWVSTFTEVWGINGALDILDSTWVDTLRIMPAQNRASNVEVTIGTGCVRAKASADTMEIFMLNGSCVSNSGALLIDKGEGTFTLGTASGGGTNVDVTKLINCAGTFSWYPDEANAFIGKAYIFGGTFNSSATTNNTRAKVLGGGAGNDIYVFEGATLNVANGRGNITVAGSSQLFNFGGTVTTDHNTELAITYNPA